MYKIIIIEDDEVIRENIVDILEMHLFEVTAYEDGNMALLYLEEAKPDLILCDIMMPGIDGYEILAWIRENKKMQSIPFVFVTAKAEKVDMKKGLALGADDYLVKPFSMQSLISTINTHLSNAHKEIK